MFRRLVWLPIFLALQSTGLAAKVVFVVAQGAGQLHDLRWGLTTLPADQVVQQWGVPQNGDREDAFPLCATAGTQLGVKIEWENGETPRPWTVACALLKSTNSQQTYWFEGLSTFHAPNDIHTFPIPLPTILDRLVLTGGVIIRQPFGLPGAPPTRRTIIYNVLSAPQAPMQPAWVSVLNWSTVWGYGATTPSQATTLLGDQLHARGTYNGGFNSYIASASDSGETFQLRRFLNDPIFPYGECNEFADFLVCLANSVGGLNLVAQRSNSIFGNVGFNFNTIDPTGTNSGNQPHRGQWRYHQFGVNPNANFEVWDGCLDFFAPTVPAGPIWGLGRDTTYYGGAWDQGLVSSYISGSWSPRPAGGFVPVLTTN